jgi:uncharacterized repeat protein (TIGR01451 family)
MKKYWILGASAAMIAVAGVPVNGTPAIAQVFNAGSAIAQSILRQPKVHLHLVAEQQVKQNDKISWAALDSKVKAKPGDIFRFTVTGKNDGSGDAKNLVITQPVPQGTVYQLNSATIAPGLTATYSIDQGKTFVERPVVQVKLPNGQVQDRPAPESAYTHVRWSVAQPLAPGATMNAAYQVKVR